MDRLEQALHVQMMSACPNRELVRALSPTRLLLVLNRYMFDLYIGMPTEVLTGSMREHLRVVECLLAGDPAGAAAALEAHLRASCEHWQQRYRQVARISGEPAYEPYLSPVADDDAPG
jgi:DNA-binding GntR family transcriptional regulator